MRVSPWRRRHLDLDHEFEVENRSIMRRLAVAIFVLSIISLTGCAAPVRSQGQAAHSARTEQPSTHMLVDYAGKPCGNQNMHVKVPVCLFPRME
jgi:hypothetical protein